ncbi:MAG: phage tail tape measure protein [Bacteroides sp.]
MPDEFGVKIKLSVDPASKTKLDGEIKKLSKTTELKIDKITIDSGKVATAFSRQLKTALKQSSKNLVIDKIKVNSIDTTAAVKAFKTQLTDMLSGLKFVDLKNYLGKDAIGDVYAKAAKGDKAAVAAIEKAKKAASKNTYVDNSAATHIKALNKAYDSLSQNKTKSGGFDKFGTEYESAYKALTSTQEEANKLLAESASLEGKAKETAVASVEQKISECEKYIATINAITAALERKNTEEAALARAEKKIGVQEVNNNFSAVRKAYSSISDQQFGNLNAATIGPEAEASLSRIRVAYKDIEAEIVRLDTLDGEAQNSAKVAVSEKIKLLQDELIAYNKLKSEYTEKASAERQAEAAGKRESTQNTSALSAALTLLKQVDGYISKNPKAMKNYGARFDGIRSQIFDSIANIDSVGGVDKGQISSIRTGFLDLQRNIRETGDEGYTMGEKLKNAYEKFGNWSIVTRTMMAAWRGIKQVVTTVKELDTSLAALQFVTRASDVQLKEFSKSAADVAKTIGGSITDILGASQVYSRLGFDLEKSLDLSKYTTIFSRIGDVEIGDAEKNITSMVKAFNIDTDDLESLLDKIVDVDNKFAISSAEIGAGMQNAASSLMAAGNTIEQSMAILTAGNTTTQDIDKVSTAIRTITARIQNSSSELSELGEELPGEYDSIAKYREKLLGLTGVDILEDDAETFRATYDILNDLAGVYDKLSGVDQASVRTMLAGTRQTNIFNALMSEWGEAQKVMETTKTSSGTMAAAQEIFLSSIQGRLDLLSASFQDFAQTVMDSGLIKWIVSSGTTVLNILTSIIDKVGTLPALATIGGGLLSGMKNIGIIVMPCPACKGAAA